MSIELLGLWDCLNKLNKPLNILSFKTKHNSIIVQVVLFVKDFPVYLGQTFFYLEQLKLELSLIRQNKVLPEGQMPPKATDIFFLQQKHLVMELDNMCHGISCDTYSSNIDK